MTHRGAADRRPFTEGGKEHLLTPHQWQIIADWIKYCKLLSQDHIKEYSERLDIDADLKATVMIEQRRRVKELGKLEQAIEQEARLQSRGAT